MRAPRVEVAEVDARSFSANALVQPPETVNCTLENGEAARCVRIVVNLASLSRR